MKLLVFDIGSNSIRTAVCTRDRDGVCHVGPKRVYTTRLAEGLACTGRLSPARMRLSLDVIRRCVSENSDCTPYAYATSAVRDAENRAEFAAQVAAVIGAGRVRVLDGDAEAHYALLGADATQAHRLLDLGGGSTQLVTANERISVPFGCVRARDIAPYDTLHEIEAALLPVLARVYAPLPIGQASDAPALIGVGGTITTLMLLIEGRDSFDPNWRENRVLHLDVLPDALGRLDRMGKAKRASIPLLHDRHDVILHGGCIVLYLMRRMQVGSMLVSVRDGLDGYALSLLKTR